MAFFRKKGFEEGINYCEVIESELNYSANNTEYITIIMKNEYGVIQPFNILTTDTEKIDALIKLAYSDVTDENINDIESEINEKDFIGLKLKINVGLKNGYLSILEIMEWSEEDYADEDFFDDSQEEA